MGGILFRRPALFSLLFALVGALILAHGLAVDNAESSRGGLAVLASLTPLPLLWRTALAFVPSVGQNGTRTAASSPRFYALLALALATHAACSCWLWWRAGEPFFGGFFAVTGGLLALQQVLFAVVVWRFPQIQGQNGAGVEFQPDQAEPGAAADRPGE
jgi:hypothetical protein